MNHDFEHRSETEERIGAERRRRSIRAGGERAGRVSFEQQDLNLINIAVAGLCEAVRDYAIFILDPRGVIVYWGMGAHLMKWWTREEAEGAHLRLLYPEGGSEDGTAEAHLLESAQTGEYVGEGQRVRRGGSTFWAHVVLTALRDPQGKLIGFAKVTQDLTKRRALEASVALANEAQSSRDAAMAVAEEAVAARERAEEARLRAEAARERAEQAAANLRQQTVTAQEHLAPTDWPALAARVAGEDATRAGTDAYIDMFRQAADDDKGA
ncbi:MAG TPA: PAS domain-containing protein [Ramlibacter sp.]